MEAHAYYQEGRKPDASAGAAPAARIPVPRALWGVVTGIVLSAALLIALPVTMIVDRSGTYEAIRADQPHLGTTGLDYAFYGVIATTVVLHVVGLALMAWFGLKAMKGRPWARIALTITTILLTIGSAFSAAAVPGYLWAILPSDAVHVAILVLLWAPRAGRDFFAAHRAAGAEPAGR